MGDQRYDVFVSYASEDQRYARALANALSKKRLRVWFAESALDVGDSLHTVIQKGIASAHFGVVILSKHFLTKPWPLKELNGFFGKEVNGKKVILPVWHNVSEADVQAKLPIVAERLAVSSASGLPAVVSKLHRAIRRAGNWEATHLVWPNNTRMAVLPLRRGTDALLISQNLVTNAQYRRFVQQTRSNEPL